MERQIIWVASEATSFAAICEECLVNDDFRLNRLAYRAAKVEGSLTPGVDVGFIRCRRGHRLCARRTTRPLVGHRG
jgi:hypothetical protein